MSIDSPRKGMAGRRATVDLVTGFLGAGKTTFIRDYAAYLRSAGHTVGIIENEFGMAGVDADVLAQGGFDVEQLVGGCICCTQKVGFHDYLIRLSETYDRIIVEPSGIFNVDDYIDVISSPDVSAHCRAGAAITVVSAGLRELDDESRGVLCSQLMQTGCVVLSHMEDGASADAALAGLSRMLYDVTGATRDFSGIAIAKPLAERSASDYEFASRQTLKPRVHVRKPSDHQALYNSTTLRVHIESESALCDALQTVMGGDYGDILRIKGCARVGDAFLDVNCTPGSIGISPCMERVPEINVIGRGLRRGAIRKEFERRAEKNIESDSYI